METKRIVLVTFVSVGAKEYTAWEVPARISSQDLDSLAWEAAVSYAEMYGVNDPGEYVEEEWDSEQDYEVALHDWEQVDGWWEVYHAEKHDGHLLYGHSDSITWNKY